MSNETSNNEYVDVSEMEKLLKRQEHDLSDSDRLVRIEALLHTLITEINKVIEAPDPYEIKMDEILNAMNEIKEQNKLIAKSLLAVIKKLEEFSNQNAQNNTQQFSQPQPPQPQTLPPPPAPNSNTTSDKKSGFFKK